MQAFEMLCKTGKSCESEREKPGALSFGLAWGFYFGFLCSERLCRIWGSQVFHWFQS